MHRGIATFTLDSGKAPRWLFQRMVKMARNILEIMMKEYGPEKFVERIADPVWFQSLGTVLAFDWNASGLTTVLTGALKEAIRGQEKYYGLFICGGKGKTSLKTPEQIHNWADRLNLPTTQGQKLIYNSKMSAKVDSSLIQDGYNLYHHTFFFTKKGSWAVVQQGMNQKKKTARRYHWHSKNINDLIENPHSGIASQKFHKKDPVLNMTSKKSASNRDLSVEIVNSNYTTVMKDIQLIRKYSTPLSKMISLKVHQDQLTLLELSHNEFHYHPVVLENFSKSKYLDKILWQICDRKPKNYQELLSMTGVGPKTIRALSLVSEVIYGAKASYQDPARYSFAHGGKDGTPYFVDRPTYDQNIEILRQAIRKSRLSWTEKNQAINKLR